MVEFIHAGDAIDFVPAADIAAGEVVATEDLLGVTKRPIKAGELGTLHVVGAFEFPKDTGSGKDIPFGKKVYWDGTNKVIKKGSGGGAVYAGKCARDAGEDEALVLVRLEQ
jgi:predicted RecA/RadA family phage recombinase